MTTKTDLLKLIRSYCLECLGYEIEPRYCTAPDCKFYPFRMAKDPWPSKSRVEMGKKAAARVGLGLKK